LQRVINTLHCTFSEDVSVSLSLSVPCGWDMVFLFLILLRITS